MTALQPPGAAGVQGTALLHYQLKLACLEVNLDSNGKLLDQS